MLKKVLIGLLVFIALLLGSLAAIPFVFKDKILDMAKAEINKQINAKVDFGGIGLSIFKDFPDLTFTLNDLTVIGIGSFEKDTLAAIAAFSVSLDIMSVIKGETIDIKAVRIDEPRFKVLVLGDGVANYDIMKPAEEKEETENATTEMNFKLQKYSITKAQILYDDKPSELFAELVNLNHSGSGDFTLEVFDLVTLTSADRVTVTSGGVTYLNGAELDLKIDLGIDLPNNKYAFKENSIRINDLTLGLDGNVIIGEDEKYDLDVTFNTLKTDFKSILSLIPVIYTKDFEDIKTSGNLALTGFAKGVYQGENYPAFGLNLKIDNARFQYPDLPTAVTDIHVDLNVDNPGGDLDNTVIDAPRFNLKLGNEPVALRFQVRYPISDPDIEAALTGKINLGNVAGYYPLSDGEQLGGLVDADASLKGRLSALEKERYNDVQAKGNIAISNLKYKSADIPDGVEIQSLKLIFATDKSNQDAAGIENINATARLNIENLNYPDKDLPSPVKIQNMQLTLNPAKATLDNFNAIVGKSDFKAQGEFQDVMAYAFGSENIIGNLTLTSNLLDLNEWITETEESTGAATSTSATTDTLEVSSAAVPSYIDFVLNASIGKVLYDNMELSQVSGKVTIKDETVSLSSLKANLLDGEALINGKYSTKEKGRPVVDFIYDIRNIDVQQAYKTFNSVEKLAPIAENITGRISSKLSMTGKINDDLSLDLPSLIANGKLELENIKISNVKPLNTLADKFKLQQFKTLDIKDSWNVFEVINGRVFLEPFNLKVNNINMDIGGSHGLDNTLDYNMLLAIPSKLISGNDFVGDLLSKSPIPGLNANTLLPDFLKFNVGITGNMDNPDVKISLATKENEGSLKDRAKEELERMKKELEEKARAEADKLRKEVTQKTRAEAEKIIREAQQQADKIMAEARALSDKVKSEGYAQADKLLKEAKNPIAKVAAEKAADQLKKESDNQANKIINEADKRAKNIVEQAKVKAANLK